MLLHKLPLFRQDVFSIRLDSATCFLEPLHRFVVEVLNPGLKAQQSFLGQLPQVELRNYYDYEVKEVELLRVERENTGPYGEFNFWKCRMVHMNSLVLGLKRPDIQTLISALKNSRSHVYTDYQ
ncbi:unnamed protein product [Protopolystoma xenopodis]|uniref:Uncharacterized protein n=1 Tax=Protopolystoma xenopodis TaxID=117903 RepID=A0A3S5AIY2_9PLAT|nr:unnamed protein product [Protopolystoma xenopodis]